MEEVKKSSNSSRMIMFHSVGNPNSDWYRNWLSVSVEHFDFFCKFLSKKKYTTLHLDEWHRLNSIKKIKTKRDIVLTFDDGYLDNWTFAYPILKKYKLKGTIFINPEFIDPSKNKRKNFEDVGFNEQKIKLSEKLGFLNWSEIKEMQKSGVIDIQSHTMSHNRFFHSDKIIDIFNGQREFDWLAWIDKPENKPYYINTDLSEIIPLGYPIFENDRSLAIRRFFPDSRIIYKSIELWRKKTFLDISESDRKKLIIDELNSIIERYPGRYETDKEIYDRYHYEIVRCKDILEAQLKKPVNYICWPGGGYNELAIDICQKAGYKGSTISSNRKISIRKRDSFIFISRFGMGSFIYKNQSRILSKSKNYLVLNYKARTGNIIAKSILKLKKIISKSPN